MTQIVETCQPEQQTIDIYNYFVYHLVPTCSNTKKHTQLVYNCAVGYKYTQLVYNCAVGYKYTQLVYNCAVG